VPTYKSKRYLRRVIKNWIIFSVCFIVLLSALLIFIFSPRPYGRLEDKLTVTELSPSYEITPFDKGCAYINRENGELYYIDEDGYKLWGYSGATEQTKMRVSNTRLAVFASSKLQMVSSSGEYIYSKTYDYPIQDLQISDSICIMRQIRGAMDYLVVIDKNGEILDTIVHEHAETILSFGVFTNDDSSIWIITADVSGITPIYRFKTYKYDSAKHITVSYSEYNQIIYKPIFKKDKICLLGSHEIIYLDYSGKVISRTRCVGYEVKKNDYSCNPNVFLLSSVGDLTGSDKKLLCVLNSGISYFVEEDYPIISSVVTEKYMYVFTNHYMYRYDFSGFYKVTYPLPEKINNVYAKNNVCYIVGESIYRLELD